MLVFRNTDQYEKVKNVPLSTSQYADFREANPDFDLIRKQRHAFSQLKLVQS